MCVAVRQHPTTFRHVSRGLGCPLSPRWLCHSKPRPILLSLVSLKRLLLRRLAQFSTAAGLVDAAVYGRRKDDRIYARCRTAFTGCVSQNALNFRLVLAVMVFIPQLRQDSVWHEN